MHGHSEVDAPSRDKVAILPRTGALVISLRELHEKLEAIHRALVGSNRNIEKGKTETPAPSRPYLLLTLEETEDLLGRCHTDAAEICRELGA